LGDETVTPIAILDSTDFHSLLIDPEDPEHILFGSHTGIQESHDGGVTWEDGALRNVDAMQLTVSLDDSERIYATGHDVFQVSRDGGQTWQPQVHDLPDTDIHGFTQDLGNSQRLYAFANGTFTTVDGGATWHSLPDQPAGSGMLTAGRDVLYSASGPSLVSSRDFGMTWQTLSTLPSGQVISLAVSRSDPQTLYAGTPNGIAKSTDGGVTWTALGPQGVPVFAVTVSPNDSGQMLFVSNEGAIYRTDDGGETWRS
jgi:photosystem II stability/assembly factor-like uncharacterized protein